nr:MAG TPA: hypothetical protein [Caudoviricetes sp.]
MEYSKMSYCIMCSSSFLILFKDENLFQHII